MQNAYSCRCQWNKTTIIYIYIQFIYIFFLPLMHQTLRWQSKLKRKCERESESSSCQVISVSERNTLCDRCCPAVTQPEPYTILPFDWRPEPANTSSTGGGATAAITPSQRGQPAMLMHYMTCLHTLQEPAFMTCTGNKSASHTSQSENNNMIRDFIFCY